MIAISNKDLERILDCLDVAQRHYKSLSDLTSLNKARCISMLRHKINQKLSKTQKQ